MCKSLMIAMQLISASACASEGAVPWMPEKLNQEMHGVAYLESSFGLFQNHRPHSRGPFYTAIGPLGLKPVTAHMEYMRNRRLRAAYPELTDYESFNREFASNTDLYYACANAHWAWLRKHTRSLEQTVYAWRWGWGSAMNTSSTTHSEDSYVIRYMTYNMPTMAAR